MQDKETIVFPATNAAADATACILAVYSLDLAKEMEQHRGYK
jgi:hypothetical protein